ncbi:type IV pilin protein [Methylomonas sp. 2BW1-5-20]|uniref:type IV pilin protein n=1 Tax=Methylomonas sp. 2BW1-5-20 TaxID=3376686 RepID=UPI00404D8B9F
MKLKQQGVTLIELLTVVVIVGVLAAIAIPSYQASVSKSRRADATGALLALGNAMERHYTENNNYCDSAAGGTLVANCGTGTEDTGTPSIYTIPIDTAKYYTIIISAASTTSYTLRATPTGPQTGNGVLELTNTGVRRWDRNNDGDFLDTDETQWD